MGSCGSPVVKRKSMQLAQMNQLARVISNIWKRVDRRRSEKDNEPILYFMYRVLTRSIRIIWRISNLPNREFQLSIYGVFLRKRSNDFTYRCCLYGHYGTFLADEIEKIKRPTIFLDIGANIGLFTLIASKNSSIEAIYAFEPDPSTFPFLKENVKSNHASRVNLIPLALSNSSGSANLYGMDGHSGASSTINSSSSSVSHVINSVGHQYLDSNVTIPMGSEIFVKIDVEGSELNALKGLANWSNFPSVTNIFIEFDTAMSDVTEMESFLRTHGYDSIKRSGSTIHWDELWIKMPTN